MTGFIKRMPEKQFPSPQSCSSSAAFNMSKALPSSVAEKRRNFAATLLSFPTQRGQ
jgi:hypothetical protein